jgi:Dolichyl-phosphate-mannose-protein mannosyltransferase
MGMEPSSLDYRDVPSPAVRRACGWLTALAVVVGLALAIDTIFKNSATYDEVAYLKIAARWWRTGDQSEITRMGSPVTFWKLQQVPVLWLLDHIGYREWIDEPIVYQRQLLPVVRLGSLWIWLLAIGVTAGWARRGHGPRAMALAAWLFALSPNLIAHGTLATMELPLVAFSAATFWFFWRFLDSRRWCWFWASAAAAGLAFSCKFTAIIFPPIIGVVWWLARWQEGEKHPLSLTWRVWTRMIAFVVIMVSTNLAITGFARIPLSTTRGQHPSLERWVGSKVAGEIARIYETPLPQDWVGFATQMHHQASGGLSYLWGELRLKGWWYYYLVALAVKVPLGLWVLVAVRLGISREALPKIGEEGASAAVQGVAKGAVERAGSSVTGTSADRGRFLLRWLGRPLTRPSGTLSSSGRGGNDGCPPPDREIARRQSHSDLLPLVFFLFLAITAVGSARNYGIRYLLPLAPLAIVWVSAVAESRRSVWPRVAAAVGLAGLVTAVASSHPYELTYFNVLAGGSEGGRHILADSNLDWGQGLESLAKLQQKRPEFRNLTFYYFGDTDPAYYGVSGRCHVINAVDDQSHLPGLDQTETHYLAVSASLQFGPWGPPGFFRALDRLEPVQLTADTTIAIYRTAELMDYLTAHQ